MGRNRVVLLPIIEPEPGTADGDWLQAAQHCHARLAHPSVLLRGPAALQRARSAAGQGIRFYLESAVDSGAVGMLRQLWKGRIFEDLLERVKGADFAPSAGGDASLVAPCCSHLVVDQCDFLLGLSEVQASIPATPDGAALIEDINRLAEESDVELLTFSPGLPVASTLPGLVEIQIQLTFEAPYFKMLSFLFALEDLERLVRIDQIAVTSRILDDGTNLLSTSLTASAFSQSDLTGSPPDEVTP